MCLKHVFMIPTCRNIDVFDVPKGTKMVLQKVKTQPFILHYKQKK